MFLGFEFLFEAGGLLSSLPVDAAKHDNANRFLGFRI